MTTIQINGITLSGNASQNMAECFPADQVRKGDYARSTAGRKRRNDRRARIAAKAAWLNS